jgi:rubrerythrin
MPGKKGPLAMALKFEQEGRDFFTAAAEKSGDPLTREIYEYLAMMELKHMEDIKRIAALLKEKGSFPEKITLSATSDKTGIFKEALKKVKKEKVLAQEEVVALRDALALEFKGREMYEMKSIFSTCSPMRNRSILTLFTSTSNSSSKRVYGCRNDR